MDLSFQQQKLPDGRLSAGLRPSTRERGVRRDRGGPGSEEGLFILRARSAMAYRTEQCWSVGVTAGRKGRVGGAPGGGRQAGVKPRSLGSLRGQALPQPHCPGLGPPCWAKEPAQRLPLSGARSLHVPAPRRTQALCPRPWCSRDLGGLAQ